MLNTNRLINSTAAHRLSESPHRLSEMLTNSIERAISLSKKAARPAPRRSVPATGKGIRRILVPLDGTPFAEHAIPLALGIARKCDAVIHLVHVMVPVELSGPFEALHSLDVAIKEHKTSAYKYLANLSRKLTDAAPVCVASTVVSGVDVAEALHENYGSSADLIVMATHGRGAFGRFWWGSVAHSLLRRTSVPVILVPGSDEPANVEPYAIEHVVLPLDGNEPSQKVVEPLLELGLFPDANHTLLHVTRPEPRLIVVGDALRTEWVPSRTRHAAGVARLTPIAKKLAEAGRRVRTKIVSSDEPVWDVVSRHARHARRKLIACTYRRPRLWERLVRPSTSKRLFRAVDRSPLMLVRD